MLIFEPAYLLRVFLIFTRIGAVLSSAPFFSSPSIPRQVKLLTAILFAYALSGLIPGELPPDSTTSLGLMRAVGIEILTGLALGFAAQFLFWMVQFAGEILGFQMGLSLAQAVDPINSEPSNPLGRALSLTFLLLFLLLDGHHYVLRALVASFELVPLAGANLGAAGPMMLQWTGAFLLNALRLAAPFMVTIFLVDAALGVFARVVPQADLFSIGLPLKLMVGLGMFYVYLAHFFPVVPSFVEGMLEDLMRLIQGLRP